MRDDNKEHQIKSVIGPGGRHLTLADLPPTNTTRWVMRRKAEVVAAVRGGLLSVADACERYNLSEEEFSSWQKLIEKHGIRGLRTTRLQQYRKPDGHDQHGAQATPGAHPRAAE